MDILRIAQHLYPDTKGGGQYHVHAMSRDQAAMGHDVTVLTTKTEDELPSIEKTHGYTVVRVPRGIRVAGNDISPGIARYLWKIDSDDFDVMHAHSHLYFATNIAALKRRLGDVPLAITNHGLYSQSAPEKVFRWYLRTLGRWTFNQADVVFCYTETEKKRVQELGVSSRIEVVSNGIDTTRFSVDGAESDLIDKSGQVVLFVGRLVKGKRPNVAVEAFANVLEERPDVALYVCGDGPLREKLQEQVSALDIDDDVTFLGHVPYDEMPKIYRSSDVLILPSRTEGIPRTILEAIVSGVQPVTSELPQLRSILGTSAQMVNGKSPIEVGNAVLTALEVDEVPPTVAWIDEIDWQTTVEETTRHLRTIVD